MNVRLAGALAATALAVGFASPAKAQDRLSIAVMPTQHFSATAESAETVTQGLIEQFDRQGYNVMPMDNSRAKFQGMGLGMSTHYADSVAVKFGRSMGADLVAYPRLLALGIPASDPNAYEGSLLEPAAVVHLRVINVHTGAPIYFRQIAHEFRTDRGDIAQFNLPQPIATAAAGEVTGMYFERVAGSRQEFRGAR